MKIEVVNGVPRPDEYCKLRAKCGMAKRTEKAATLGLPRSIYSVVVRDRGTLIGMGRIVGDLGCHVQITDIAVDPNYQGRGLGNMIMEKIMFFIDRECPETCFVNLFADVDFLYQKFGFVRSKSLGMRLDR